MWFANLVWLLIIGWMVGTLWDTDWSMHNLYRIAKRGLKK